MLLDKINECFCQYKCFEKIKQSTVNGPLMFGKQRKIGKWPAHMTVKPFNVW